MRILHWTDGFWPRIGGIETLVYRLALAQRAEGHEVRVMTQRDGAALPAEDSYDGIAIHRLSFTAALREGNVATIRAIAREAATRLQQFEPDVVHVHVSGHLPWLYLLAGKSGRATVATLHVPWANLGEALPPSISARLVQSADAVMAVSEATRLDWCGHVAGLRERVRVVTNGVPPPAIAPTPLADARGTILCLGRLDRMKGFDVALQAFTRVVQRDSTAQLAIVGDGPERGALERLAAEMGLRDHVAFRGWVAPEAVAAVINEAAMVLVPSRWEEPFGLVAVEAAWMGRPVIASRVGGLAEVVVDDETGLLVPSGDVIALAHAIESLRHDPVRAARLGVRARQRAAASYGMERCAGEYREIYGGVLASAAVEFVPG